MYTSWHPEGDWVKAETLAESVPAGITHVVITGGEPMIFAEQVGNLCAELRRTGHIVTVETNGTIYDARVAPDLWSVSPKLASATPAEINKEEKNIHLKNLNPSEIGKFLLGIRGREDVQYKFVVTKPGDVDDVLMLAEAHELPLGKVWLMPEGKTREEVLDKATWVAEECKKYGFNLCMRVHALIWGARRGV